MKTVGIDTNIVLRLIVDDDADQRLAVLNFGAGLNRDYLGFITIVSLIETDWALRTQYGFKRDRVVAALKRITSIRGVTIQKADIVAAALRLVDAENADFADALIALQSRESGCTTTLTFDRKAILRVPGMQLLTAAQFQ
jgi:predicted nucleic-acid-binding protein